MTQSNQTPMNLFTLILTLKDMIQDPEKVKDFMRNLDEDTVRTYINNMKKLEKGLEKIKENQENKY